MRIKFRPIIVNSVDAMANTVVSHDIISRLNPSQYLFFDSLYIYDEQSYSDYSRYELDIYKVRFDRCYKYSTFVKEKTNEKIGGLVQVIELNLNFWMDFDFRLFANDYVDSWKNDTNIDYIRPKIYSFGNDRMGYYAFRSLATSFFAKAMDLIHTKNILCYKKGRKIILAYNIDNKQTENNLDDILDFFLDGIYEMVKCTSGRFNYDIPEESGQVSVGMENWYNNKTKKKKLFSKKKCVTYPVR